MITGGGGGDGRIEGKRSRFIIVKMESRESIPVYEVDPNGTIFAVVSGEERMRQKNTYTMKKVKGAEQGENILTSRVPRMHMIPGVVSEDQ